MLGQSFSIRYGGIHRCDPQWSSGKGWIDEHCHKCYIPLDGSGWYEVPAGRVELAPGSLFWIPGHQRQRYGCPRSMRLAWWHVQFDEVGLDRQLAGIGTIQIWSTAAWQRWQPVWERMDQVMAGADPAMQWEFQALVATQAAALLRLAPPSPNLHQHARLRAIAPGLALLRERFLEAPAISEAAAVCRLSRMHFHRLFRAEVGCTPHQWVERRRLDLAQRLLCSTTDAIAEVARQCGYEDPFYFTRVVRRRFRCSPTDLLRRSPV
jgi:AraC-like DNA-binding protein